MTMSKKMRRGESYMPSTATSVCPGSETIGAKEKRLRVYFFHQTRFDFGRTWRQQKDMKQDSCRL
jgi:hypothetical protein